MAGNMQRNKHASPPCRKSSLLLKFSFLTQCQRPFQNVTMQNSKWAFPNWLALSRACQGEMACSPSSPEEKVMDPCRWGLQSLSSCWRKKSGDRPSRAALRHWGSAAGCSGFAWSCSSPALTHQPQVAGTVHAIPALWGKIGLDHTRRTEGSLKPIGLSRAPSSLLWICPLFPAYFLPLAT